MTTFRPLNIASFMRGADIDLSQLMQQLGDYDRMLGAILNRGIAFKDNVDCSLVSFTSSATPDAENTVAHSLNKIPTGYIVYGLNKGAVVYTGTSTWSKTQIFLKVNTASVVVKIIVF